MDERRYQNQLIKKLRVIFGGCLIIPNDPQINQGIPDLLILHRTKWAMLEVKASANAPIRPNQEYYVEEYHGMSFCSFIYPENEHEVLYDLKVFFTF